MPIPPPPSHHPPAFVLGGVDDKVSGCTVIWHYNAVLHCPVCAWPACLSGRATIVLVVAAGVVAAFVCPCTVALQLGQC